MTRQWWNSSTFRSTRCVTNTLSCSSLCTSSPIQLHIYFTLLVCCSQPLIPTSSQTRVIVRYWCCSSFPRVILLNCLLDSSFLLHFIFTTNTPLHAFLCLLSWRRRERQRWLYRKRIIVTGKYIVWLLVSLLMMMMGEAKWVGQLNIHFYTQDV